MYGIPHGCGANLLMWRTDKVNAGARLAGARCSTTHSPVQGQGHGLRQPDLHRRRGAVPEGDPARPRRSPTRTSSTTSSSTPPSTCSRSSARSSASTGRTTPRSRPRSPAATRVVGTTWQVIANLLEADKVHGQDDRCPKEGSTGWSDTWMISSKAKHPNCMYKWMNYIISPEGATPQVAEWFGEAPANREGVRRRPRTRTTARSSTRTTRPTSTKVAFWTTPTQGLRRRPRRRSARTTREWVQAWTEIKG